MQIPATGNLDFKWFLMVRHVLFSFTQLSHFQDHCAQLWSVLCKTQKRLGNPLSEDEKDVDHLEEGKDLSDEEEEIPGIEKATPKASGADMSQPRPSRPTLVTKALTILTAALPLGLSCKGWDLPKEVIVTYGIYGNVQRVHATSLPLHTLS